VARAPGDGPPLALVFAFAASCADQAVKLPSETATSTAASSSVSSSSAGGDGGGLPDATGGGGAAGTDAGVDADARDAGDAGEEADAPIECGTVVEGFPLEPSPHVPVCIPIAYSTNPPTSGPHYPIWAAFKTYDAAVPRGFYVHDLEHGAIVITYNCNPSCDAELAQLATFLDTLPADPLCVAPLKSRIVVTPDPHLDVRFAASAWGFSLRSNCFDLTPLGTFISDHYAMASENSCFDGVDVTSPDAGVPSGCGEPVDAGTD